MGVAFYKMNGLGNDFVVIDARAQKVAFTPDAAKRIGDRHRGVGFDQLLSIESPKGAGDAIMRIWNPDGSTAMACGNGARCVGDLLLKQIDKPSVLLSTPGGLIRCSRDADGRVTVDMGEPKLDWQDIPLAERMDTRTLDIKLGPIDAPVLFGPSAVNMGNPHCIFFVENIDAHDPRKIGPMIENHPLFPDRANVSFAQVKSKSEIRVELDGGALDIFWREDNHVLMTGPTELNYAGELDDRYFAGANP